MSSRTIYQELADQLVALRNDIDTRRSDPRRRGPLPTKQALLGGIVKAFKFRYDDDGSKTSFNGVFWFDLGNDKGCEHQATFILHGRHAAQVCYDIVDKTSKLDHEAVLEVYFTAYCEKLGSWVLACERFDTYLFDEIQKVPRLPTQVPAFFTDPLRLELQEFWIRTVRNLMRVLALSRTKCVVLDKLNNRDGYVIVPSGEIKVFGIGGTRAWNASFTKDLTDLREFFWSNNFFDGALSEEWRGFDSLLGSTQLMNTSPTVWEPIVLNHPTLLSPFVDAADNHAQLTCYMEIERFFWNDLTVSDRVAFINALYVAMPQYRWARDITQFPRQNVAFTTEQENVYTRIYSKANYDKHIYAAVIICVRNLVRHGYDCSLTKNSPGWDKNRIAREIKLLFGGFMSMAYTVSKLSIAEWHAMASNIDPRNYWCLYYK